MTKEILKYYKPNVVVGLIAISGIGIYLGMHHWGFSVSILGVIGIMLFIIDEYLWKFKPFSWMYWIEDFSGRYEGFLEYEYRDKEGVVSTGRLKHVKIISQTGSKICVFSFTIQSDGKPSTMSENKGMFVEQLNDGVHYNFVYNYLNAGNGELKFSPHYGTEVVKYIKRDDAKYLEGRYYTERLPFQTRGKFVDMKRVSDDLKHDF